MPTSTLLDRATWSSSTSSTESGPTPPDSLRQTLLFENVPSPAAQIHRDPDGAEWIRELTLSNGMRVFLSNNPYANSGTAALLLPYGALEDEPGFAGTAHLLEHMRFRFPDEDGKMTEERGLFHEIEHSAFTGLDFTTYRTDVRSAMDSTGPDPSALYRAVYALADLALETSPRWTEELLEREIRVIETERRWNKFNVVRAINGELLAPTHIPDQFDGDWYIGSRSSCRGIDLATLERFQQTYYRPDAMTLFLDGKWKRELDGLLEERFGTLSCPETPLPTRSAVDQRWGDPSVERIAWRSTPDGSASFTNVLFPSLPAGHPNRAALRLLLPLLNQPGGPLAVQARSLSGIAYSAGAWETWVRGRSYLTVTFDGSNRRDIVDGLSRLPAMRETLLNAAYIDQVLGQTKEMALRDARSAFSAPSFVYSRLNGLPMIHPEEAEAEIRAVTTSDFHEMIEEIFQLDLCRIIIGTPRASYAEKRGLQLPTDFALSRLGD